MLFWRISIFIALRPKTHRVVRCATETVTWSISKGAIERRYLLEVWGARRLFGDRDASRLVVMTGVGCQPRETPTVRFSLGFQVDESHG